MFSVHAHAVSKLAALALATGAIALTGAIQASADTSQPFTCTNQSGGMAGARGTVFNLRAANHTSFDRLVIGLPTTNGVPSFRITQQSSATFTQDPSGQPTTLEGSAGLRLVFQNTDITSGAPSDIKPNLPEMREVKNIGNFERVVSYGIGLSKPACFRVLELSGPSRLVIDVAVPSSSTAAAPVRTSSSSAPATTAAVPLTLAATGQPQSPAQPSALAMIVLGLGLVATAGGARLLRHRLSARKSA
jgi:hypothetical protein